MLFQVREVWDAARLMAQDFLHWLPRLALGIVVFALFWAAAAFVRRGVRRLMEAAGRREGVSRVVARLARWGVLFAGALVALSVVSPSLNAGTLVSLLGLSGVAIGFAFKDILQNFLAGILILLTEPFRIGDQIIAGDFEGTVEEVETRATTLKTYDGRRVVIPNGQLYTQAVTVNTAYDRRRSQYDFGIDYEDDVEQARQLLRDAMDETEGIASDPPPDVYVLELADSSVNLRARWWTNTREVNRLDVQDRLIRRVKEKFDAEGVDFPYPIHDVRITRGTLGSAVDRVRGKEEK